MGCHSCPFHCDSITWKRLPAVSRSLHSVALTLPLGTVKSAYISGLEHPRVSRELRFYSQQLLTTKTGRESRPKFFGRSATEASIADPHQILVNKSYGAYTYHATNLRPLRALSSVATEEFAMSKTVHARLRNDLRESSRHLLMCVLSLGLLAAMNSAFALPSYAQQTGMACSQCHTIGFGPALSSYGRQFKLYGYTWGNESSVPLAAMIVGSYDHTDKNLPDPPAEHYSTNSNGVFDEASVFLAGRLFGNVGSFAQITYSGIDRKASWDNVDVRYSHPLQMANHSIVAGVSVNNNPTIQDLWNSTPGWGFPYVSSELAPTPAASPLIADGLGQKVLGTTFYAMLDDTFYVELGGYRGLSDNWLDNVGVDSAESPHLRGFTPYWRAVIQRQQGANYFSGGIFGLSAKLLPEGSDRQTDSYTDVGIDGVYQYDDGQTNAITANLSYIRERRSLRGSLAQGLSDSTSNHLNTVRLELAYAYQRTWNGTIGLFDTTGSRNSAFYAPTPVDGSATGSPASRGYTLALEFVPFGKIDSPYRPFLNARFGLEYTGYDRFNGGSSNYDGFGRSAGNNNTLFAYSWLAF